MTTVFISGSRKLSRLNKIICDRLQNVVDQRFSVLIGDADGVDKAVQVYLLGKSYRNVTVYCSGSSCRNNLGNWNARHISADPKLSGRDFYTQKDKEMAADADHGFVIWDGKSPGSLNNIFELLGNNKFCLVYFSPDNQFYSLFNLEDAQNLLDRCDPDALAKLTKKIKIGTLSRETLRVAQGALNL